MLWSETSATLQFFFLTATFIPSILSKPVYHSEVPRSNPLGIDWGPAPPPEDGPPLSAGASRDKALLPAQISGIVGAYLFSLCVVGILLVVLGRRLRKQAEEEGKSLGVELVETAFQGVYTGSTGPTPTTPSGLRNYSWPSPDKKQVTYDFPPAINPDPSAFVFPPTQKSETNPYVFPATQSVYSHQSSPSVDNKIVEADREMLARDLEDIYAHVMEQEEAKAAGIDVRTMPPPKIPSSAPSSNPQQQKLKHKPSIINTGDSKSVKSHSRASSILSSLTSPRSPKTPKSPRRKGIRGLRISAPIATPLSSTFPSTHSDEEPLTPRSYVHRPPPPIPKNQVPYSASRPMADEASPTRSMAETFTTITPISPEHPSSEPARPALPSLNTRNLHLSLRTDKSSASPLSATETSTRAPFSNQIRSAPSKSSLSQPPPAQFQHKAKNSSSPISQSSTYVASTSRSLPFRQFEPSTPSLAVPSTKTTVLERVPRNNGPQTGGLRTPFSGGAVPYSPYQPFTPMMPITPRLVTKEDRKRMKKAVPRTPVMELIKSEDEIWDSGY